MLKQVEKPTQDDEDALVGNEEIKEEVGCVCLLLPPPMMFKTRPLLHFQSCSCRNRCPTRDRAFVDVYVEIVCFLRFEYPGSWFLDSGNDYQVIVTI